MGKIIELEVKMTELSFATLSCDVKTVELKNLVMVMCIKGHFDVS